MTHALKWEIALPSADEPIQFEGFVEISGGALVLYNFAGNLTQAYAPGQWSIVERLPG